MNQGFSTTDVGRKIKELRLKNDLTQMNLADAMSVSYQAVSNWERGNSMPDISKLGNLANLLNCSIDELLGSSKETELVKKVMEIEKTGEGSVEEVLDAETLSHVAPVLKPTQVQNFSNCVVQTAEENHTAISFKQIAIMAPFLDEDSLDEMIECAIRNGTVQLEEIEDIVCYLKDETITKLVKAASSEQLPKIIDLAPFIDENVLGEFALRSARDGGDAQKICQLKPFLESDALDKLVFGFYDRNQIEACRELYPFLEEDSLKKLLRKMLQDGKTEELHDIMPFI